MGDYNQVLKEILDTQKLIVKTLQEHGEQLRFLNERVSGLECGQQELKAGLQRVEVRLESEAFERISALFDAYSLRGGQIENLKRHVDERLDSIETDTRYLVARVAKLEKLAK